MPCRTPSYDDYISSGGTLPKDEYSAFIRKAWAYLDAITLGRVNTALPSGIQSKVMQAAFAIAEEYAMQQNGGVVASATNDGYSETYVVSKKTPEQRVYSITVLYLASTGLLYSGMGGGCCC